MNTAHAFINKPGRLQSLNVMRGLIMFLLAGESCMLYTSLDLVTENRAANGLVQQFFHHPWHDLRF